jgi:hypothetical protein
MSIQSWCQRAVIRCRPVESTNKKEEMKQKANVRGNSRGRSIWAGQKKSRNFKIGLWAELIAQNEWYLKNGMLIDEEIENMTELLPKHGSVFTQHWFYTPDCCQLAADTFLHPLHFPTSSGAMLYLPLTSLPYYKNNPIALHLQAIHIIRIKYRQKSHVPHPPIYPIYENVCKWYVPFQSVAFLRLIVALMDPFDIQKHIFWYRAIDTNQVHILVKFERRLSISVQRNKSYKLFKNKWF